MNQQVWCLVCGNRVFQRLFNVLMWITCPLCYEDGCALLPAAFTDAEHHDDLCVETRLPVFKLIGVADETGIESFPTQPHNCDHQSGDSNRKHGYLVNQDERPHCCVQSRKTQGDLLLFAFSDRKAEISLVAKDGHAVKQSSLSRKGFPKA